MLRPWILQIQIDKQSSKALFQQIVDNIIVAIQKGTLKQGEVIPSSRILAEQLGVSRKTVVNATDNLIIEGWLISKDRIGLFVVDKLPQKKNEESEGIIKNASNTIVFDDGLPDTNIAPMKELARAYRQIFNRKAKWQMMGYSDELGEYKFREAISSMLNHTRGMNTNPSQICITRGSQMALYLSAHTILKKGDVVLVENPGYKKAWDTFSHAEATILPIDVDEQGVSVEQIEEILSQKRIKAIYITPHHQYPTTVSLSQERRLKLVELSKEHDFIIIEDDYDHDFHFSRHLILPLSTLIETQHFIYIGSLSKMISPALRIGYLVADTNTIKKIGALRKIIDVQGDNIMEQAILELIKTGEIRKHIKRTSKTYKAKRDFFANLLETYLSDKIDYKKPEGGLAFWIQLKKEQDIFSLYTKLISKGVQIITPDKYSFNTTYTNGIRLGYASLSEAQLKEAVILLSKHIE